MKLFARILAVILVLLLSGMAQAQITINYVLRDAGCELYTLTNDPGQHWGVESPALGPFIQDLDIVEGDHSMRSVHDSSVILDGSTLMVDGSYLGSVSTTDQASLLHMSATANLMVMFTPLEPSTVLAEATVPAGGEAWFFDLTGVNDFGFDFQGPGTVVLDDVLIPEHDYVFQVFYGVHLDSDGPNQAEKSATMSMTVAPDPVATAEVAWGSIKALFR